MNFSHTPLFKGFLSLFKGGLLVGVLAFLIQKGLLSWSQIEKAMWQWHYSLPAMGLLLISNFLGAMRWHILLQAQQAPLSLMQTTRLTWIGFFFNQLLPGAVSGDVVKAFYVGRLLSGYKTQAFGSLLFDRLVGLSALLLVLVTASAIAPSHDLLSTSLRSFLILVGGGVSLFYAYLLLLPPHHPKNKMYQLFQAFLQYRWLQPLQKLSQSIHSYHFYPTSVLQALCVSLLMQVCLTLSCHLWVLSLGGQHLPWPFLSIAICIGLLITAIPLTPAGIGTGNLAFLYLFEQVGFSAGADLFSLLALCNIAAGAFGGLIYWQFKTQKGGPIIK